MILEAASVKGKGTGRLPGVGSASKKGLLQVILDYKYLYIMLLPGIVFFIIFRYVPMYGVQLAFKEYMLNKGINSSPGVGFAHFQRLFMEPEFFVALRNTLIISALRVVWGFPFPIVLALMINEVYQLKYKRVLQTVLTFPHFLSWIIVSGIVLNLLGDAGAVKKLIMLFNPVMANEWGILYSKPTFRSLLIVVDIWKEAGWGTIIYLATIAGIDPTLFEAATIDGCSRLQKIRYVTLPGMMSMIIIMLVLRFGSVMEAGFEQIFNMYSPPVYEVSDIIDTYIYRITFQRQTAVEFGFSTAVGLFKSVTNFILLLAANWAARLMGNDGIM
jgi:putative aldouronate transport system permease protein